MRRIILSEVRRAVYKISPTVLLLTVCGSSPATTITFDFDSGIDLASFSVFNVGELFTINTDGPDLRISKPEDDGTVLPQGWLYGGIASTFTFDGDFSVTIDFTLSEFPPIAGPSVNGCYLRVGSVEDSQLFQIYRNRSFGNNEISTWLSGVGVIAGQPSTLVNGRFRITRVGTTVMTWFSEPDGAFTPLGTAFDFAGPLRVQPFAAQGPVSSNFFRATTALDVSFDNLVIEADQILTPCLADVDGNDIVGIGDFLLVLAQWGPCPPLCLGDVDGDNIVGINDLLLVLAAWGPCP